MTREILYKPYLIFWKILINTFTFQVDLKKKVIWSIFDSFYIVHNFNPEIDVKVLD